MIYEISQSLCVTQRSPVLCGKTLQKTMISKRNSLIFRYQSCTKANNMKQSVKSTPLFPAYSLKVIESASQPAPPVHSRYKALAGKFPFSKKKGPAKNRYVTTPV